MELCKRIVFLYGSETGVSEEYCNLVASVAANNGAEVSVVAIDEFPLEEWGLASVDHVDELPPLVFFVSTAGQGDMPLTMRNTWERLRMSDAPALCPKRCRYAVFGLGDSTYSKYNYAAKMFHNRLQQLGATPLVHRGLGDERDGKGIWQELGPWLENSLWPALGLKLTNPSLVSGHNRFLITPLATNTLKSESNDNIEAENPASQATDGHTVGHRPGCWDFAVASNTRLTAKEHYQHVSFVEFIRDPNRAEGLSPEDAEDGIGVPHGRGYYQPGDCLALYPTNSDGEISRMLRLLSITDSESKRLVMVKPNPSWGLRRQTHRFFFDAPVTIKELLTRFIDLEGTASQTFLRMFANSAKATGDVELVERMTELGMPKNCEDYNSFAYREKRTMTEVMEDFPFVPVTLEALVSNAPLMRPRYYSISSSPTMDKETIGITVARFDLKTPLGRERKGLCSRLLCSSVGGGVSIFEGCFLRRPFDVNPKAPLILIGPGTGVAPLRSIIRERWALAFSHSSESQGGAAVCGAANSDAESAALPSQPSTPPEMILFFGCRNQKGDFLHGSEWQQFAPSLTVVTAFSRDDPSGKKEYVQHKLIDDSRAATKVFKLLTNTDEELQGGGGVVIICGNAKHMPASVQDALANILAAGKGISKDEAVVEVNRLRIRGRIKFETWSV